MNYDIGKTTTITTNGKWSCRRKIIITGGYFIAY